MNKMLGNVKGNITGKVVYGTVVPKKTNNGKDYDLYQIGVKLPSGCTVFISNRVFETTRNLPATMNRVNELDEVITKFNAKEDIYISLNLKPDKETGENRYAKFSTYLNKEDKVSFSGEGFISIIDHVVEDDKVKLIFTNARHEEYTVDFEDSERPLTIQGYVSEVNKNFKDIVVVDGAEQYGQSWNLLVAEHIGKQLVVGQGYAFNVVFEKGEMIQHDNTEEKEAEFDFSGDFSIESLSNKKKTEFMSDKLKVTGGGLLKGQSIKIKSAGNSTPAYGTGEDEFPF